jgi:hypothetical protein
MHADYIFLMPVSADARSCARTARRQMSSPSMPQHLYRAKPPLGAILIASHARQEQTLSGILKLRVTTSAEHSWSGAISAHARATTIELVTGLMLNAVKSWPRRERYCATTSWRGDFDFTVRGLG